jgi:hypothetical protein
VPILLLELAAGFVAYVFSGAWYLDTYRPTPTMALSLNQHAAGKGGIPLLFHVERAGPAATKAKR